METLSKPQMCSGLQAQLLFASRVEQDVLTTLHQRLLDYLDSDDFLSGIDSANRVYASVKFGEFNLAETAEALRAELARL